MKWTYLLIFGAAIGVLTLGACGSSKKTNQRSSKHANTSVQSKFATKLGVSAASIKNERLYVFIDQWEGVPYAFGGVSKSGVDCSGFVSNLYRDVYQKQLPRTTSELAKKSKKVSKSNLKEGDLVFFDINGKKTSHVGVYLQNNKFVHASTSKGVIVSDLTNPYYQKAFSRGGKL
ncbi:MAG: NlpC/P60 family protein [Salibacteraceae bacterium]